VKRGRIGGRRLAGIGATGLAALVLGAGIATASPSRLASPHSDTNQIVKVASGRSFGVPWAVGMGRRGRQRCYAISADRNGWSGAGSICSGRGVEGDWDQVYGDAGNGDETSVEIDLTSTRVRTLRLLVHQIDGETQHRSFHPKLLSKRQSRLSGLPRDFRFVVIVEPREFCVEAFETRTHGGNVVDQETVPCED
jgi:hypothetical protein